MEEALESRPRSSLHVMLEPLNSPVFRRIWSGSLMSNLGLLIGSVGAAWAMTQLTTDISIIALVQTAAMLPGMLITLVSGAIADMYDRRKVGLVALSISLTGAAALAVLSATGHITPWILLTFIFIIGSGMALFAPAWQASVAQQVPAAALPAAIGLNGISYNIARSFGPAIGGVIVATLGATWAFGVNAVFYLPLLLVLFLWRPVLEPSRLPPERLGRAVVSGMRYVINAPPIRTVLIRAAVAGLIGGTTSALMPLIARDLLQGTALIFGIILGAFGLGAVIGALTLGAFRKRLGGERSVAIFTVVLGAMIVVVGLSRSPFITVPALLVAGAVWTSTVVQFNISTQLYAPRWVAARALAAFQTAVSGGIAIGSWFWGQVAHHSDVGTALVISGAVMLATPLLGFWLRMPADEDSRAEALDPREEPEVDLALTGRSGPIVVHVQYRVASGNARAFYGVMQDVQLSRQRNGGYGWSISRDISDAELWVERFHCPTWHDFLRLRDRPTKADQELSQRVLAFHIGDEPIHVRRLLERPFGSVRWKEDVRDLPAPVMSSSMGG